jgi:sulfur-oxidizing protein SoxX
MKKIITSVAIIAASLSGVAATAKDKADAGRKAVEKAVVESWPKLSPEMQARVDQDETILACSVHRNNPPAKVAEAITAREKASIAYPADGTFMGDWKKGEKGALSGYGFRMGDDPKRAAGGNCYACHQLSPAEISYGTLGPSLLGYGKMKGNTPEAQKEVYEKIYNAQAVLACSNMPRFGHNKVLSPESIKDYVAYLLDPASPVNQGQ